MVTGSLESSTEKENHVISASAKTFFFPYYEVVAVLNDGFIQYCFCLTQARDWKTEKYICITIIWFVLVALQPNMSSPNQGHS